MGEPAARRDKVLDLAQLAEGDVLLDVHRGSTPGGSYLAGVLTKAFRGEVLLTDAPLELDYARLSSGSDARRSAGSTRTAAGYTQVTPPNQQAATVRSTRSAQKPSAGTAGAETPAAATPEQPSLTPTAPQASSSTASRQPLPTRRTTYSEDSSRPTAAGRSPPPTSQAQDSISPTTLAHR